MAFLDEAFSVFDDLDDGVLVVERDVYGLDLAFAFVLSVGDDEFVEADE